MGVASILALSGAAGLNPWFTLLIVIGLATFTRHGELTAELSVLRQPLALCGIALLLGLEVVASKVARLSRATERFDLAGAAAVGALLGGGVTNPLMGPAGAVIGAMVAVSVRWARRVGTRRVEPPLHPYGGVAAGIVSNVAAGALSAAVYVAKAGG
jgi:hypothetical protein